jgi:hypothetical protein
MIDPTIEKALAPSKEDWREPLWAKFKKWAVGFGAALLVVAAIVAAIAYFMPSLAPQTEPVTMTIEPIPQPSHTLPSPKRQKSATEKIATQAVNTPASGGFYGIKPHEKTPEKQADKPAEEVPTANESEVQEVTLPIAPIPPIPPQRSIP